MLYKLSPILHKAATQMGMDTKIFRIHRLGIPQDRIAKRAGVSQQTISGHLPKMPELANSVNTDLSKDFTVAQVAEKHNTNSLFLILAKPACGRS
jgi:di/tripeptidase